MRRRVPTKRWSRSRRSVRAGAAVVIVLAFISPLDGRLSDHLDGPCDPVDRDVVVVVDSLEVSGMAGFTQRHESISISLINGLPPQARMAVVSADGEGWRVEGLTKKREKLVDAVVDGEYEGPADVLEGVRAAVDELAEGASEQRDQVVIAFTDEIDADDARLDVITDDSPADIVIVAGGVSADQEILDHFVKDFGGGYSVVRSTAPLVVDEAARGEWPDADGDGLADCLEERGAWDNEGGFHVTDPARADTDGDGLTDGQEVTNDLDSFGSSGAADLLAQELGLVGLRYVVSDPTKSDTDGDGLADAHEFEAGTGPWEPDSDDDGLTDGDEWDMYLTDPLDSDSDGDSHDDQWEVDHFDTGFDPNVDDTTMTPMGYVKAFVAGASCPDGADWCQGDSAAFLAGSISGGFFVYKDVADLLGNLMELDVVGAGLAIGGLLPVAGDAASVVAKTVRFLNRVPRGRQLDGLAYVMKSGTVPKSARKEILARFYGEAWRSLKDEGLHAGVALAMASQRVDLRDVANAVQKARKVVKASEHFIDESQAVEHFVGLGGEWQTDVVVVGPGDAPSSTASIRVIDVYDPVSQEAGEVRTGHVRATKSLRRQLANDVALRDDPATEVDEIVWHFYPDEEGQVGPDEEVVELLAQNSIPYTMNLPEE
ncbi:MAG: hypothetical protein QM621_05395 [Aeromicrobium sp.]|uniref:hypothetical protein n=1 Tax=Aeromicrobium sp. TaxID=1871063 RepID=UPI0039E62E04